MEMNECMGGTLIEGVSEDWDFTPFQQIMSYLLQKQI